MLLVQYIRENLEAAREGLKKRNFERIDLLTEVVRLDDKRKSLQAQLDQLLAEQNKLSREIGELYKSGRSEDAAILKAKVADLKTQTKDLDEQLKSTIQEITDILLEIPNVPHQSVPGGTSEDDNEVIYTSLSELPVLSDDALPHWELGKMYDLFDFELGTKITGSGFPVFKNYGARLERALINFFLDEARQAGYEEIIPPLLVNEDTARATGQLPDKEGQMYYVEKDNLYLIPTAEVPVTNIYRDEILLESQLPIKMTAYTPCFRREAGSYGADVKGLNRVHQFDKVEIVQITSPDHSYAILEQMVDHVRQLLEKLELPYRILRLCGGDLGFTSALTYDFEVYSAAQKKWLEVSSVSNFETFQANRLKLRIKDETGNKYLAHTLNGSALALARVVAALVENNQTPEGIKLPAVLIPYTGIDIIKK